MLKLALMFVVISDFCNKFSSSVMKKGRMD